MKTLQNALIEYFKDKNIEYKEQYGSRTYDSRILTPESKEELNKIILSHVDVKNIVWVDTTSVVIDGGDDEKVHAVKAYKVTNEVFNRKSNDVMYIHSIFFTPPMYHRDMDNNKISENTEGKLIPAITDPETFKMYTYLELKWETGLSKEQIIEHVEYLLSDDYTFEGHREIIIKMVIE